MFKKNKSLKKGLVKRSFLKSSWITNFWIIDENIYFTDAEPQKQESLICKMPIKILKENLKIKTDLDREFISIPNGEDLSLISSSISDVEVVARKKGYLKNVYKVNDEIKYELIFKKLKPLKIIKSLEINDKKIFLKDDNNIYLGNKNIYSSNNLLTISKFGKKGLLVSSLETKELFYLYGDNFENKDIIYTGNYFYRLDCYKQNLIIGKPLFDSTNQINFYLPLVFIY